MKILANENMPGDVVDALRNVGHDVLWVRSDFPGAGDDEVLARASAEQRILITFDKDFGELVFARGSRASQGVILFRIATPSASVAARKVVAAIGLRDDWGGHFSVVDDTKVRLVPLPAPPAP